MMRKRALALAFVVAAPLACKTAGPPPSGTASVKDFDTGADADLRIDFDSDFSFCPNAQKFSVVNAYWLTLASAYVYATKDNLSAVAETIKSQWPTLKVEYLSSPDSSNPQEPSTQALVLETESAMVIAFRGTPLDRIDVQDIVSDAKAKLVPFDAQASLGKVHQGFKQALDSVWPQVETRILAAAQAQKPLFITGHSLGAALATLATARLTMLDQYKNVRPLVRGLYTLGSPRVGNDDFVNRFQAAFQAGPQFPIVRERNEQDIVTRSPPAALGYKQHVSKVFYLSGDGRIYSGDDGLGMARYKMNQQVAANMVETSVPTAVKELKEHFPTAYFAKLGAEYAQMKAWAKANNGNLCDDASPFYQVPAVADLGTAASVSVLEDLKKLTGNELTVLFSKGTAEPIPSAQAPGVEADGTGLAIIMAGNVTISNLAYNFWEGKRFKTDEAGKTTLVNKLAGKWLNDISAEVYQIAEGLGGDGKPSILLNYQHSNRIAARAIRDEIRSVAPGVYLGRANLENPKALWPLLGQYRFVVWFALGFDVAPTSLN